MEALEKVADILGTKVRAVPYVDEPASRRGGKPTGAISKKWRYVLEGLLPPSDVHTAEDIKALAELRGLELEAGSLRDRLRRFVDSGFLTKHPDGKFSVTESAVSRFNFSISDSSSSLEEEEDES